MFCNQCAKRLSFSERNMACSVCKFIMCKKCLAFSLPSSSGRKPPKTCLHCYERISQNLPDKDPLALDPPINYLRRMNILRNKQSDHPNHLIQRQMPYTEPESKQVDSLGPDKPDSLPTLEELQTRLNALNDFLLTRNVASGRGLTGKKESDEANVIVDQALDEVRLSSLHEEPLDKNAKVPTRDRIYCSFCGNLATVQCPACMDEEFCDYCFRRAHKSRHARHHTPLPI